MTVQVDEGAFEEAIDIDLVLFLNGIPIFAPSTGRRRRSQRTP